MGDLNDVEVLHPDVVYPALEKPATELERLVVEALNEMVSTGNAYPSALLMIEVTKEARHRRLIP